MKSWKILLTLFSSTNSFNFPSDNNSVCSPFEECKLTAECPSAVAAFKQDKIEPKICNYQSVSVCCRKLKSVSVTTTSPVTTSSPVSSSQTCGISRTRTQFNFVLKPRQADFSAFQPENEHHKLVVGGAETEENSYPWMAALGSTNPVGGYDWFCGGSYIGGNLILTAAHCVPTPGSGLSLDIVRLGAHNLAVTEASVDDYKIRSVTIHPEYRNVGYPQNDIAIIALQTGESGVRVKAEVSTICLPAPGDSVRTGDQVTVAGWGATSEGGVSADRLQEVTIPVSDMDRCRSVYRDVANVDLSPGVLCAGYEEGGQDACTGDSGGGLLTRDGDTWIQVGVVSAGIGCARRDVPGLYTRVETYLEWIEQVKIKEERLLKL